MTTFAGLFEWLEQNNVPLGLFVMLLIALFLCFICLFIVRKAGNKPMLAGRCKDCIYIRQDNTRTYGCTDYKWLLFPWSKKKGPCPVEERHKLIDEDMRLAKERGPWNIYVSEIAERPDLPPLTAYGTRKREIAESIGVIEGIFYIYNGRIIPDYYSECLMADKDNPHREEMYHLDFYCHYMRQSFTDLVSSNEKSIPRGRIAGTSSNPVIYIDKCFEQDANILKQLKELYRLPGRIDVISYSEYSCPACHDKLSRPKDYDIMSYSCE